MFAKIAPPKKPSRAVNPGRGGEMIGDTIKLAGGDSLQVYTVISSTETHVIYDTSSIAKNRLCRLGKVWLEMAAPKATVKTDSKPKSQRGKKLHFVENGEMWGNLPYCAPLLGDKFKDQILHSWRNCGLVKAVKKEFWYFRVSDIPRACELRDPIGRMVDGRQFYSLLETARRIGNITPGCVGGWITRGYVEVDRQKSAVLVICWAHVIQHCKLIGREIENDST